MPADKKFTYRNRTIDEEIVVMEAKRFVMSSSSVSQDAQRVRDLLCIIERLAQVTEPEYHRAIFNERTDRHGSQGYLKSATSV